VAQRAAPIPSSNDIARAEKLVRERFLHEGEDPSQTLAAGTPRRAALDLALAALEEAPKRTRPSTAWRRQFSLLLGLERVLSEEEPKLADGTLLSAHQVDALSGTLTALLAEAQRTISGSNGRAAASASPELLASAAILGLDEPAPAGAGELDEPPPVADEVADEDDDDDEDEELEDDEDDDEDLGPVETAAPEEDDEEDDELEDELVGDGELEDDDDAAEEPELQAEGEEPQDWVDEGEDEEELGRSPTTPTRTSVSGSSTATGAGKTVAARWGSWRPPRPVGF
jgi:hypothetical protein